MRFIAVERSAAQEIISNRTLQSVEYDAGRSLGELLLHGVADVPLGPRLELVNHAGGLFFLSATETSPDFILFDLETSGSLYK